MYTGCFERRPCRKNLCTEAAVGVQASIIASCSYNENGESWLVEHAKCAGHPAQARQLPAYA
jgi:hypothetical protein